MKKKILILVLILNILLIDLICINASTYVTGGVNIDLDLGFKRPYSDIYKEFTVSDKSQFNNNQPYFNIDLSQYNNWSLANINKSQYNSVVVIFQMDIKEIYDGYQEIYLYNNASSTASELVNCQSAFEHGSGYKNTKYKRYEFYAEISKVKLTTSVFTIRYGAHGNGSDDWKFKDLEIQICLSKDNARLSNLMYVENAITSHIGG